MIVHRPFILLLGFLVLLSPAMLQAQERGRPSVVNQDRDMAVDPSYAPGGSADVGFMRSLLSMHETETALARDAVADSRDPQVKSLARRIVSRNEQEILKIKSWLKRQSSAELR